MDWYLDATDLTAARELREELAAYLRRHAEEGSDFEAAELAFWELVTNVARHAAGAAWISVEWTGEAPVVSVRDLGPGFELDLSDVGSSSGGRGLYLVSHLVDELSVASRAAGGADVRVTLPIRRARSGGVEEVPPKARPNALPDPDEARDDGTFDREAFLRALVVQLSIHLEQTHGPDAADAAVTQVGLDVGSRMEDAYRRAQSITERLTPEEMGDLYVRLKYAIEGRFYVVEATDERIVLGNHHCPFGDVVKRAPGLCRMTSSVFGGIASRNTGRSAVQLEERIAVGDPGCRVIVWLGDAARREHAYADMYESA